MTLDLLRLNKRGQRQRLTAQHTTSVTHIYPLAQATLESCSPHEDATTRRPTMTATTTGEAPSPSDPPAAPLTTTTTTTEATTPDPQLVTADDSSQSSSSSPPPIERPRKKATTSEMRAKLEVLGLDTHGKRETLWKRVADVLEDSADRRRLFAAFNRAKEDSAAAEAEAAAASSKPALPKQPWGSFLCFDVEATCEQGKNFDYPNEIIVRVAPLVVVADGQEFPVVLLQWEEDEDGGRGKLVTVDTFHTYVRPTWRPVLSDFCSSLTGITQEVIDAAPTFPEVLGLLEAWLDKWDLRDGDELKDALWVTDGPWDLRWVAATGGIAPNQRLGFR